MTIQLQKPDITELKPRINVFGVGGGGGNAVNNMINAGLQGVEFVVANTDAQALTMSKAERRIQLGVNATDGLGAGSHPEIGREAAEECMDEILDHLGNSHMVFVTAGMGGGTGTGAAPVIARAAREKGILTVGVVTKPFHFEGQRRMKIAEAGIEELQKNVDTLIVIPNQNLFRIANEQTTFADAFSMADQVLYSGVASITDLMVHEGLVNLDFADVRSVMQKMGKAMMGTGEASDTGRALAAAEAAIANPLLDETSMRGARGLLISITGGRDMTLFEVDEAANRIREEVDPDANVIFGAIIDEALEGVIRVSVVATGIDARMSELNDGDFSSGMTERTITAPADAARAEVESIPFKKDSASIAAAETTTNSLKDEETEENIQEEAGVEDTKIQARIFNNPPRSNPSISNRTAASQTYYGNLQPQIDSETESAGTMAEAEAVQVWTEQKSQTTENATNAGSFRMNINSGASAPQQRQMRSTGQIYNQESQIRQMRNPFPVNGVEDFPAELRQTLSRQDKDDRSESTGGARGFIKKLQNFFGSSDEIAARLEPADEEEEEIQSEFTPRTGRVLRRQSGQENYGEMPMRADRRSVNMGRTASVRRPEPLAENVQRALHQEEREEEKLEIPAFLRRQSN